jgi:S1-C subfamily serine protease
LDGLSTYFYESGSIKAKKEFSSGNLKENKYKEYDEKGNGLIVFLEDFNNNANTWDIYSSEKSASRIENGKFVLTSFQKEGTSRFISAYVDAKELTYEMNFESEDLRKANIGLIYNFQDWNNYAYFYVSGESYSLGYVKNGVANKTIEDSYTSDLRRDKSNTLSVAHEGEYLYFNINGNIQYRDYNISGLTGNKTGFVVGGKATVKVDYLKIKGRGSNISVPGSDEDFDIKQAGSGFFISRNGFIATNYHVIENTSRIQVEVKINDVSKSYNAEVVLKDEANDIAILRIVDEKFQPVSNFKFGLKKNGIESLGADVFTLGYPLAYAGMGKDVKYTNGTISSKTGYEGAINAYQVSVPVQPGNSGGPLMNYKGELVGIINAKINEGENVSYAIKAQFLKNLIDLLGEDYIPPTPIGSDISKEELVEYVKQFVVIVKCS